MEILRKPPFPLVVSFSDLPAHEDVVATFSTSRNKWLADFEAITDGNGYVEFELDPYFSRYDGEYPVLVYLGDANNKGDVVAMDNVRIVRPYIDVIAQAPTGMEEEYLKFERVARIIIDNIVGGFYYTDHTFSLEGSGADKLLLRQRPNKLINLTENNVQMYEIDATDNVAEYVLTNNAVMLYRDEEFDSVSSKYLSPTVAGSDSYTDPRYRSVTFPEGYDYEVRAEVGWPFVPQDIKEAAQIIIDEQACGQPNYWAKYVRQYQTKDFTVDFHRPSFAGTGNVIVDQILHRYLGETLYNNIRVL
mgnify:CR=1 FL=1